MKPSTERLILRWTHLVLSIPIIGYIYSPFEAIPDYAPMTRYVFVPVMVLFSGLKDALWQLVVPVLGQQVVLSRIIRGDSLKLTDWALPSFVAFVLAIACVALVARLLRDERIVFGRN